MQKTNKAITLQPVTFEDLQAVTELTNLCSQHVVNADEYTLEELTTYWESFNFDPAANARKVLAAAGTMIGYAEVWDVFPPYVHLFTWVEVHPDYQDTGIGEQLVEWALEHARTRVDKAPAGARVTLAAVAKSKDAWRKALYEAHGFKLIRHSYRMLASLAEEPPEPVWPDGIVMRTIDADENLRPIFEAIEEAFIDHFGHVEGSEEQKFEQFCEGIEKHPGANRDLCFVALDGDSIAGVCIAYEQWAGVDGLGWIESLSVRRPWRRRGLGMALLLHAFRALRAHGKTKVGLGVDASNLTGATRLYEKAGMTIAMRRDRYEMVLREGKELGNTGE